LPGGANLVDDKRQQANNAQEDKDNRYRRGD
jgi:hypothetical protein